MKSAKFFRSFSDDSVNPEASFELLLDPMRSKIVFEIVLKGQITAEDIVESTGKSRSTISHHLKKLVETGILDVYMNPTGKTKYYRITKNIERFMYTLDKKKFATGTLKDQSEFLIEMGKIFVIINQIYANIYSDQIQLLQQHQPFDKITVPEKGEISYHIKEKEITVPYNTFFITGEEQANYLRVELRKLFKAYNEKFSGLANPESLLDIQGKHIVNFQIMPYLEKKDLD